jgi:hypothetical protein
MTVIVPALASALAPISTLIVVAVGDALGVATVVPNKRTALGSKPVPTTAIVTAVLCTAVLGVIEVKVGVTSKLIRSGVTPRGVSAILIKLLVSVQRADKTCGETTTKVALALARFALRVT